MTLTFDLLLKKKLTIGYRELHLALGHSVSQTLHFSFYEKLKFHSQSS